MPWPIIFSVKCKRRGIPWTTYRECGITRSVEGECFFLTSIRSKLLENDRMGEWWKGRKEGWKEGRKEGRKGSMKGKERECGGGEGSVFTRKCFGRK